MPNRLAQETSPYLQQHADNPVDWNPWGPEALLRARAENKPILLSIGYSACHWCHVMAHESFEDPAVAAVMNELFVNIKADREERPDLDQIYQLAHQMLARRPGGWPLTMFLSPDGTPFFGGTYFPKVARFNLPGFPELCTRIAAIYREKQKEIAEQSTQIMGAFASMEPEASDASGLLNEDPILMAVQGSVENLDERWGGFGAAPKFPHTGDIALCLRRGAAARGGAGSATRGLSATGRDPRALHAATLTLTHMAEGGIFDHLGGGFCRYSVDAEWSIPHFEKMLYDNGPLLAAYADAWTATGEPRYREVCEQTAAWMMREMQSPEGGFYSSFDADSEHVEGKFYVWTPEEVQGILSPEEFAIAAPHWGLDGAPNFEGEHWHLRVVRDLDEVASVAGISETEAALRLASAREKLFAARAKRVPPGRDDKILASWNALAIEGLAHAGRVFGRSDWIDAALRAFDFVRSILWKDGRLLATYKDGRAHLNAYLDDYAFLLSASIELLQARFSVDVLDFANRLAKVLLDNFEDKPDQGHSGGGFFFTSHDHEKLIHRGKPGHDNATPSGNAVAALALQRLSYLTGESAYADAAGRVLRLFQPQFATRPGGFATLLMALEEYLTPPRTIILRGAEQDMRSWQQELAGAYRPTTLTLAIPAGAGAPSGGAGASLGGSATPLGAAGLPEVLNKPVPAGGHVNAWVCEGVTCLAPVDSPEALAELLDPAAAAS